MESDGVRVPDPDEYLDVVALANEVFRHAEGLRPTMEADLPLLFTPGDTSPFRVIGPRGAIASMLGVVVTRILLMGVTLEVASIGSVATAAAHRGRGLAGRLVDAALGESAERDLVFISGRLGLYTGRGAEPVGSFLEIERVPAQLKADHRLTTVPYEDHWLDALVAMAQAEPVRWWRSRALWERLVTVRGRGSADTWIRLALLGSEPVGYLVAGMDENRAEVWEYGGSRRALVTLMASLPVERVVVYPGTWDLAARHELGTGTTVPALGTIFAPDLGRLGARLAPLAAERATAPRGSTPGLSPLAQLFGPRSPSPLPMVWPGCLNYV